MKEFIVIDLDGTLSNCDHRANYAQMGEWDEFHARGKDDKPHDDVAHLVREMSQQHHIIIVTGRNEKYRAETMKWFSQYDIDVDALFMRPDFDFTSDGELKIKLLEEAFGTKERVLANVAFVLEDREKVVEAYRNYGLPCWQVRLGSY